VAAVFPLDMAAMGGGGGAPGDPSGMQNTTTSLRSVRMRRASCELVGARSDLRLPTMHLNSITADNGAIPRQKFSGD
jgi:hypothetical protein